REVADDVAPGFLQRGMPVGLAVPLVLRVVEEADAVVGGGELGHQLTGLVGHAVADHEHLELRDRLGQRARYRAEQRTPMVVGGNQDGGGSAHAGAPASPRSSAIRCTTSAPSAALERGGGPPCRCSTKARSSRSSGSSAAISRRSGSSAPSRWTSTCSL